MRRELSDQQAKAPGMGRLIGPDGRTYGRRTTRVQRSDADALVESGCPVVTYLPGGLVVWHDEDDAWPAWADARTALTTELPGGASVTGGRWEAVDGTVALVLVWHD